MDFNLDLDFNVCRFEEVISFFWCSVYIYWKDTFLKGNLFFINDRAWDSNCIVSSETLYLNNNAAYWPNYRDIRITDGRIVKDEL